MRRDGAYARSDRLCCGFQAETVSIAPFGKYSRILMLGGLRIRRVPGALQHPNHLGLLAVLAGRGVFLVIASASVEALGGSVLPGPSGPRGPRVP